MSDFVQRNSTTCSFTTNSSWVVLSQIEMSIKNKIESVGTPLKDWDIQICRGILTGLNEAFIISSDKRAEILNNCSTEEERNRTDEVIRPVLRGKDIKRYNYTWKNLYLINFHNGLPASNISRLKIENYPSIKKHLDFYFSDLNKRTDQGDSAYNLRSCAYLDDFKKPKLVYKEISQELSFSFAEENMVILNTAYMITGMNEDELLWLMIFLNSKLIDWYYHAVSVQLGTATRLLYMHVVKIPIIKLKDNLKILEQFKVFYKNKEYDKLDDIIYKIYGLSKKEIDYLVNTKNQQ